MATTGAAPPVPPRFWVPASSSATPQIKEIRHSLSSFPSPSLRVSRVGQLDAALLDHELEGILSGPVWKALEGLRRPGRRSWEPEMMALLRIAVLKMSLYESGATYGSGLQNLKYRNEWRHDDGLQSTAVDASLTRVQKIAYMSLEVLPPYLISRLRDTMLQTSWPDEPLPSSWLSLVDLRRVRQGAEETNQWKREWKRCVWEVLSVGERLGAVASLVNFLVFLYNGRYRTLVDRLLGMRLIYAQRSINRNVSFEFLNRQLVWEAFTEFLLFLMPLVNVHRLRLRLSRLLTTTTNKSKLLSAILYSLPTPLIKALRLPVRQTPSKTATAKISPGKPTTRPEGPLYFLPSTTCPICYSNSIAPPTSLPSDPSDPSSSTAALTSLATASSASQSTTVKVPYITDCGWGCRYCYYCIVGKLVGCEEEGAESWACLRCGGEVRSAEREQNEEAENEEERQIETPEKVEDE